jgi:hypothetical protein
LALRTGPDGLRYEAGTVAAVIGRGRETELELVSSCTRGGPKLSSSGQLGGRRTALNSRLRTGTEKGIPTV